MNTKILNPNLDVVITATGKVKIVTEIGGKLVAVNNKKLQNKLLYTASKKPESWWIDANCYDNVYDENTGKGYLLLNPGVTSLVGIDDYEQNIFKNIFSNYNMWEEEQDIYLYRVVVPKQITTISTNAISFENIDGSCEVILPETITEISQYGITADCIQDEGCLILTINATTPPNVCNDGLYGIATCYVPAELYDVYTNDECWVDSCSAILPIGVVFAKMYYSANDAPQSSWIQENCILPLCHFDDYNGYLAIKEGVTRLYGHEDNNGIESILGDPNSVSSITIPSQITTIGELSFAECHALKSVEIPETVTSIGGGAFVWCNELNTVKCLATTPPILTGEHIFDNIGTTTCIVPNETAVTNYQNSAWANYFTKFVSQEMLCNISYTSTQKLETPWTLYNSTDRGYDNVTGKGYVTLKTDVLFMRDDDPMTDRARSCFDDAVIKVSLPFQITGIGQRAFIGCSSLTEVYIPNSVNIITGEAFYNCTSLNKIVCDCETPPELSESGGSYNRGIFTNIGTDTCYVPANSITAYQNDAKWSSYFTTFLPIQE